MGTGLGVPSLAHNVALGATTVTITPAAGFVIDAAFGFFLGDGGAQHGDRRPRWQSRAASGFNLPLRPGPQVTSQQATLQQLTPQAAATDVTVTATELANASAPAMPDQSVPASTRRYARQCRSANSSTARCSSSGFLATLAGRRLGRNNSSHLPIADAGAMRWPRAAGKR